MTFKITFEKFGPLAYPFQSNILRRNALKDFHNHVQIFNDLKHVFFVKKTAVLKRVLKCVLKRHVFKRANPVFLYHSSI